MDISNELLYLRDVMNNKRRRWFNVSAKAITLFKQWVQDWHRAATLEEVLNQYEIGHVLEDNVRQEVRYVGKSVEVGIAKPRPPWGDGSIGPYSFNDEFLYLVHLLVTTPECERLRQCPECSVWFIAPRRSQMSCGGECSRLAASRRIAAEHYSAKCKARIEECRAAYAKYQRLKPKPREPLAAYLLREANRRLPAGYRMGGVKARTNFITRHADEIGITKQYRR